MAYLIHWMVSLLLIFYSWRRTRQLLHAHFVITSIFFIFLSDFLIRGYDDPNIEYLYRDDVYYYQFIILLTIVGTVLVASLIRLPPLERTARNLPDFRTPNPRAVRPLQILAWTVLTIELTKRLYSVGWSAEEVILQSLGPRAMRAWDVGLAAEGSAFLYQLIGYAFLVGGLSFSYLLANTRGMYRLATLVGFFISLFINVTNGNRTDVVLCLASFLLFVVISGKAMLSKVLLVALGVATIALSTSLMYYYRTEGFVATDSSSEFELKLVYHQDDSYYRAIYAYNYADTNAERWEPISFVTAIIANPIPRYFWPTKPLLTETYWGGFKPYYITIMYIGEFVALLGTVVAPFVSFVFGVLLYFLLYWSQSLLRHRFGIVAYLAVSLYVYQVFRSLLNLTQFMYFPALCVIAVLVASRVQQAKVLRRNRRVVRL
jgi:oligosaccharide repeat unit polymerase